MLDYYKLLNTDNDFIITKLVNNLVILLCILLLHSTHIVADAVVVVEN